VRVRTIPFSPFTFRLLNITVSPEEGRGIGDELKFNH
jgi:hypothetical protein